MIKDSQQNAFLREYGHKIFDYRDRNPDYAEVFNQAMTSYSVAQTAWVLEALQGYIFLTYFIYVMLVEALDIFLPTYQ